MSAARSNVVNRDIEIANRLRERRRRSRRRRALRRKTRNNNRPNNSQNRNKSNQFENKPHIHQVPSHMESIAMHSVLSDVLKRYCEAVTNPFGNGAIGAVLPDRYQELVIPCVDRLEFDIDFTMLSDSKVSDWTTHSFTNNATATVQLLGVMCWYQPRALAMKTVATFDASIGSAPMYPFTTTGSFAEGTVDTAPTQEDKLPILDSYVLCYAGIWRINTGRIGFDDTTGLAGEAGAGVTPFNGIAVGLLTLGDVDDDTPTATEYPFVVGYRVQKYPRIGRIAENCIQGRILGAGLKAWSEEAPINTGGYVVGGWLTNKECLDQIRGYPVIGNIGTGSYPSGFHYYNPGTTLIQNQALHSTLISRIKGASRQPGTKGITARYSMLQSPEQIEQEPPRLDTLGELLNPWNADSATNLTEGAFSMTYNHIPEDFSESKEDVVQVGAYVPCFVWRWNVAKTSDSSADNLYTLRVMSVVHYEGTPKGDSPFMSQHINVDSAVEAVKSLLENWQAFPPAVAGHTFKSFISKAKHVVSKIAKGASHVMKVSALADAFADGLLAL